jgi:hypothetical protein
LGNCRGNLDSLYQRVASTNKWGDKTSPQGKYREGGPDSERPASYFSGEQEKPMQDQGAYEKARKKVEAKIGFYIHLAVYTGVNILLMIINLVTSTQYLWFKWPLIGWGIGLLFHGFAVFAFSRGLSFKERMIEKELKREIRKKRHLEASHETKRKGNQG